MASIVTWLWSREGEKASYTPYHVHMLKDMVDMNSSVEREFICVTDQCPSKFRDDIKVVPLWNHFSELGGCYRRLFMFSEEAKAILGHRVLSIDLDCVIVNNIDHLFKRTAPTVLWKAGTSTSFYNGSLVLTSPGRNSGVFHDFSMEKVDRQYLGTDQAWYSTYFGHNVASWEPEADGIYGFRKHIRSSGRPNHIPWNSKIIFFQGGEKPWAKQIAEQHPWIKKFYRSNTKWSV